MFNVAAFVSLVLPRFLMGVKGDSGSGCLYVGQCCCYGVGYDGLELLLSEGDLCSHWLRSYSTGGLEEGYVGRVLIASRNSVVLGVGDDRVYERLGHG